MLFILEDCAARTERIRDALGRREIPFHIERTVPEAISWWEARGEDVLFASLDNDLYVPSFDGEPGEGWQLCEWLLARGFKGPIITHTSNGQAATKMTLMCEEAAHPFYRVVPFGDWVERAWIDRVETEWLALTS